VETGDGAVSGFINEKEVFRVSSGPRVVTGWKGRVKNLINIYTKVNAEALNLHSYSLTKSVLYNKIRTICSKSERI
jgi:hypothetical protein